MSLEPAQVKVEHEDEDEAWPRADTSVVERPSKEGSAVRTEESVLATSYQEHAIMQGLELDPNCIKEEEVKEVAEETLCGVSEAAARAGLYAGHAVKDELVLGPETLQAPDIAFAAKGVRIETNTACSALAAERARGSCPGERPGSRGVHIELKACLVKLDRLAVDTSLKKLHKETNVSGRSLSPRPASQALAAAGASGSCTGEGLRFSESRPEQQALRSCSVRLERMSTDKHVYMHKKHPQSVTRVFLSDAALREHKQALTTDTLPKCPVCNKLFSRRDHLKRHFSIHTREKPYECDVCNKKFKTSSYLFTHKRIHTGEKPYTCDICNKKFISASYLRVHKRNHTGEKLYECDICNEQFDESSSLNKHKLIHTKEKFYKCDICNKQFNVSKYLIIHYMSIHPGKKPYKCDICNKRCSRSKDLISHKRIHTGEKPYPCNICRKPFSSLRGLTEHKRIHTGEKPYMCDNCGKQFIYMTSLIAHKRTHTGEKPFACDICHRQFPQLSSLAYHKHIHTGEKRYACGICNKQFYGQDGLNKHNRSQGHIKRKTSTHVGHS